MKSFYFLQVTEAAGDIRAIQWKPSVSCRTATSCWADSPSSAVEANTWAKSRCWIWARRAAIRKATASCSAKRTKWSTSAVPVNATRSSSPSPFECRPIAGIWLGPASVDRPAIADPAARTPSPPKTSYYRRSIIYSYFRFIPKLNY